MGSSKLKLAVFWLEVEEKHFAKVLVLFFKINTHIMWCKKRNPGSFSLIYSNISIIKETNEQCREFFSQSETLLCNLNWHQQFLLSSIE